MKKAFPLFINLSGKKVLVVGGGTVATRRIRALADFGASITVVAPGISPQIAAMSDELTIVERAFAEGDVDGAFLVLALTDKREVNRNVFEACRRQNIPVNVCDSIQECSFYFPALFGDSCFSGGMVSNDLKSHASLKEKVSAVRKCMDDGKADVCEP